MQQKLKIAVLVSGSGSNLQVMIDAMQAGKLPIEIVGVISNNDTALANERTKKAGIELALLSHVPNGKKMSIATFEKHALAQLEIWQPDLIVLAGFMRVLSAQFIAAVPAPMINLHPSLLPVYKGLDTHQRVLAAGDKFHGCSVHLVTAELDAGQVLTQARLAVKQNDTPQTLSARVQKLEHTLVPLTLEWIAKGVLNLNQLDQSEYFIKLPYQLWFD